MEEKNISEKEALEIISRTFDYNLRRMNFIRGGLFIFWGLLIFISSLAEYGLFRWSGDSRWLWSWLVPLIAGFWWTLYDSRRKSLARTQFDNILILIWGFPAMISACAILYSFMVPDNTMNPVGVTQLLLGVALVTTSEFYRGKGSQQSGSFAALLCLGMFEVIFAFNYTFRMPFDAAGGTWMIELAIHSLFLLVFPGLILRHLKRKQCSKN